MNYQEQFLIYRELPGAEWIIEGMKQIEQEQEETESSLLVQIGSPRLQRLGFSMPFFPQQQEPPEHRLYRRLAQHYQNDAHSRYNALIRHLVSFERALERSHSANKQPQIP